MPGAAGGRACHTGRAREPRDGARRLGAHILRWERGYDFPAPFQTREVAALVREADGDLADEILAAAGIEAGGTRARIPIVVAAFARARELGLTLDAVVRGFAPPAAESPAAGRE